MEDFAKEANSADHTGLIRLGGMAMLVGFSIHAVANWVLKVFPPENASLAELQTYLLDEAGNWAIVHGDPIRGRRLHRSLCRGFVCQNLLHSFNCELRLGHRGPARRRNDGR